MDPQTDELGVSSRPSGGRPQNRSGRSGVAERIARVGLVVICAAATFGVVACSSPQNPDLAELQAEAHGEEIPGILGSEEARARGFLEELTYIIDETLQTPDETAQRVQVFLRMNREALLANAGALQSKQDALDPELQVRYEAAFDAYVGEAFREYLAAIERLGRVDARASREVRGLLNELDRESDEGDRGR